MTEYAITVDGEIVNVITCSGGRPPKWSGSGTVVPLESLPLDVKRRYRYWNERP